MKIIAAQKKTQTTIGDTGTAILIPDAEPDGTGMPVGRALVWDSGDGALPAALPLLSLFVLVSPPVASQRGLQA